MKGSKFGEHTIEGLRSVVETWSGERSVIEPLTNINHGKSLVRVILPSVP